MHRPARARQIRQSTDESGQVDLTKLGELVSAAYEEGDRDRRRTDRAIKLMIEELELTHKRAEQDLLRAREFLDSIIENIPIAVFAKDAKDSATSCSIAPAKSITACRARRCWARPAADFSGPISPASSTSRIAASSTAARRCSWRGICSRSA